MKLVIEEARDHMECLDQVRKAHGNDCLIVHSFKQPDSYCIIVAIESADVKTGAQLVSSVVGTTVPQASPLPSKGGVSDAVVPAVSANTLAEGNSQVHTTPEISPSILELARELGALSEESKSPKRNCANVSQNEFEALSFSEVLDEVVSKSISSEHKAQPRTIEGLVSVYMGQADGDAFFDVTEMHTPRSNAAASDSAMLFSSIISKCINMESKGYFIGTQR